MSIPTLSIVIFDRYGLFTYTIKVHDCIGGLPSMILKRNSIK